MSKLTLEKRLKTDGKSLPKVTKLPATLRLTNYHDSVLFD